AVPPRFSSSVTHITKSPRRSLGSRPFATRTRFGVGPTSGAQGAVCLVRGFVRAIASRYGGGVMTATPRYPMAPDRPVASASPGRVRTARVLFVLGLLIVAALSSLVWWSIRSDPDETRFSSADRPSSSGGAADDSGGGPGRPPVLRAGRFTYRALAPLDVRQRCDDVSYGKVREWFAERPCREVIRGLFDVRADGARAAVAVSVVTMPSRSQARALK